MAGGPLVQWGGLICQVGEKEGESSVSEGYSGRVWTCPFFHWDKRQEVHCEGGCVKFQKARTHLGYVERFCGKTSGWESCTLAKALLEQYEREEEGEKP